MADTQGGDACSEGMRGDWRWRLETDEVVELELPGFPEGGDERAWHGLITVLFDGGGLVWLKLI